MSCPIVSSGGNDTQLLPRDLAAHPTYSRLHLACGETVSAPVTTLHDLLVRADPGTCPSPAVSPHRQLACGLIVCSLRPSSSKSCTTMHCMVPRHPRSDANTVEARGSPAHSRIGFAMCMDHEAYSTYTIYSYISMPSSSSNSIQLQCPRPPQAVRTAKCCCACTSHHEHGFSILTLRSVLS